MRPRSLKIQPSTTPPHTMAMCWHDLLFMHWPIKPQVLRPLIPEGLALDTCGGDAWIAVVPFRMTGIRPRLGPAMPWLSAFAELNVRTYVVSRSGKPGVWFFSLDAANPVAVRMARWTFHLPYFDARMKLIRSGDQVQYRSVRTHRRAPPAEFSGHYRPTGQVYRSRPGDLDHWLTERYCLHSADAAGQIYQGDILHEPWPLQPAEAEIHRNTMGVAAGVSLPDTAPLLHFCRELNVIAWRLHRV